MTMPVMEPNLDAATLRSWARAIDGGPFASLCWGERIAFDNPDSLTLLGALSAWTERVRLVTTVIVPQLHDPVMLAKALATGDMVSGGRLTVGIGVGGRHEDYDAVGAGRATQTMRAMAERVAIMKRVWAKPHLATSFWFAMGDGPEARDQVHRHLRRYMNWIPAEFVDAMAPTTGWAGSDDELLAVLKKFEAIGADEVHLIPTSANIDQLRRVADVAKEFG
jgi:hypothetical protein